MKTNLPFILSGLILLLMIWLSSGTLAPYAANHYNPVVLPPCNYLANLDHRVFMGPVWFLQGQDVSVWGDNIMLRRLLYPLLSYPFMSIWNFELGGFIANIFIHLIAFGIFIRFIYFEFGRGAALAIAALLCTYPGICYWSGLPYAYALIVPCSLLGLILIWKISERPSWKPALACALGLGILSTGYDLLPYFAPASIFILFFQKRYLQIIPVVALMALPSVLVVSMFRFVFDVNPVNSNSGIYKAIFSSYLNQPELDQWWLVIKQVPAIFLHNFIYSNFIFLPLLFLLVLSIGIIWIRSKPHLVELGLALAVLAVFLFNNLAPPYEFRWQIRGEWVARIYQPVFIVFLLYIARQFSLAKDNKAASRLLAILVGITVLLNASISFGPLFGNPLSWHAYHNFYQHSRVESFAQNLEKFGKRPFGFCDQEPSS